MSGDYDFQFMIEELAVGAQFKLPYVHVLVNNSYLGLIRQSQRGFDMDLLRAARVRQHQRTRDRGLRRRPREGGRGPGLQGDPRAPPEEIQPALRRPKQWMEEFRVPVVVEIILERVTNIAMGTEIDAINEFEALAERGEDAPTAISMLD
jgi:tartronate-semialdehyde synthase